MKGLALALALCVLMNAFSVVPIFGMDEIVPAEESAAGENTAEQSAVEETAPEENAAEEDSAEEDTAAQSSAEEDAAEEDAAAQISAEEDTAEESTDEEILTALSAPVARIGDAEYESLPAALAAAASGDTITMLDDAWAEETLIKVEGNGILTITGNESNGGSAGTLTTLDGSGYAIVLSARRCLYC